MFVYIPTVKTFQRLLNRGDVIDIVLEEASTESQPGHHRTQFDGSYFKNSSLLSRKDNYFFRFVYS